MKAAVTYTNLEYPFGKLFAIKGLGQVKNGEPVEVDEEEFKQQMGRTVTQAFAHRGDFTVNRLSSTNE